MALELARRGVPTRCIDQSSGIDPHVRANLLHSRTLEILQGLGLDEQVTIGSVPEKSLAFYRDGEHIGDNPHAPVESPFPYGLSQSQAHTESTLETSLKRLGVKVERSVGLTSIKQDGAGVKVSLRHGNDREETEVYDWVVGCDGAHSTVRKHLGIAFPGEPDHIPYILGDVVVDGGDDLAPTTAHIFFHEDGELYLFTRLPKNRQFVVATLANCVSTDAAPTLEDLQAIVSKRSGRSLVLRDPQWLGHFRISYRQAEHYRKCRVFLAGDAAHVHSLLGGHGMNMGVQDAHNLAWKLALVAKGEARSVLLDTYEQERRRVDRGVIDLTRQITDTMEQYVDLSPQEKDKLIAYLFTPDDKRLDGDRTAQEISTDYAESPLTLRREFAFQGGPEPGTRAPDADGLIVSNAPTSLFKMPSDVEFRLFLFCAATGNERVPEVLDALASSKRFERWVKPYLVSKDPKFPHTTDATIIFDEHGTMHQVYAADGPCLYLVRPDGYVAYRSSDLKSIDTYFAQTEAFQS